MGTLFDQQVRARNRVTFQDIDELLTQCVKLAIKYKLNISDVILAKQALELERQNTLYINNGDAFDEQIAGIGKILQTFVKESPYDII